jgi:hypothetical protein
MAGAEMTNLPTLKALRDRIKGLEGPDRKVDAALWVFIGLDEREEVHCRSWCRMDGRTDLTREHFISAWASSYTESIDASLALVERLLPGWDYRHDRVDGSYSAALSQLGAQDWASEAAGLVFIPQACDGSDKRRGRPR